MSKQNPREGAPEPPVSRRRFLASSAATAALVATGNYAFAQGANKPLRVGVVGCGGRGSGAALNVLDAAPDLVIRSLGDLFPDRMNGLKNSLKERAGKDAAFAKKIDLAEERCFTGFDSYKKVIDSGIDYVILATPPGFRPSHLRYAVEKNKHVFMEKPVAVDPVGVRSVIASGEMAAAKKLGIVAGTQRRHQASYIETIRRIHNGDIGEIVTAQAYWNQGGLWKHDRQPSWSDMEWQIRNWLYFTWLSGDHIVEQHVHNLDVINWTLKAHPEKAMGTGGRQARTGAEYGHVYDHFAIEYEYPGGVRVLSMCRQQDGTASRVAENIVGTKGTANPDGAIRGENRYRHEGGNDPYVQEHTDLINSIRAGKPLNEARQVAESTLTAIMGRLAAYTGQEVTWEQALALNLDLMPERLELGPLPVPPVAVPGQTRLEENKVAPAVIKG